MIIFQLLNQSCIQEWTPYDAAGEFFLYIAEFYLSMFC